MMSLYKKGFLLSSSVSEKQHNITDCSIRVTVKIAHLKLQLKFTFLSRLIYNEQFINSGYGIIHWTTDRGISTCDVLQ